MAFPRIEPQPNSNNNSSSSNPSTNLNNQVGNRRLSGGNQARPPISKSGCATAPTSTSIQSSSNPNPISNQQSSTSYYLPPPGYLVPQDSNQQRRDSISSLKTLTDSTSTSSTNPLHKSISSTSHPPLPSKDSIHSNGQDRRRSHDERFASNADRPYGRAGSFHPPSSPLQHVVDQFLPNFGVGNQHTEIPNHQGWRDGKGKEKQNERANHPGLSHSDWSVPQAKAILSTYATLATLLAGTTTTLLTYYRNPLEGDFGPIILGITQAALILNIYAALLAVGLIAVSITLQTPNSNHNHHGNGSKDADVMQMFNSSSFSNNRGQRNHRSQNQNQDQGRTSIEPRILSPLTVCILDRLTLGVSWLITLAGAMELLGLFMYAAHFQSFEVGISMSIGGVLCLLVTGVCVFAGWAVSGKETDRGRANANGRGDYASLRMNEEIERNRNEEYERSRSRTDEYQRKKNEQPEEGLEVRSNEEDQQRIKPEVEVEMKTKIQPQPLSQPQSQSSNRTIWAAR